jgi:S1-C subfamily serine protease
MTNSAMPISTQSTLNSSAMLPTQVIMSVVMVFCHASGQKGTGWLVSGQQVITNEHVVRGAAPTNVAVRFSDGTIHRVKKIAVDAYTDLAALDLDAAVAYTPLKIEAQQMEVADQIYAWGYPLGYSGPPPILTVGYLAGFNTHLTQGMTDPQLRLVLNAALNPGNSGGPIFKWGELAVRGVAVTKHAPITPYLQSAIEGLKNNASGVVFTATNSQGGTTSLVESQVVAEILEYFRDMTQVVIGEAICAHDLIAFLNKNHISWTAA